MENAVQKLDNIEIPMRDGIILRADLYRPAKAGRIPSILLRLPYGKDGFDGPGSGVYDPYYFADHGYNVIIQDCRGFYHSDGIPDVSGLNDGKDGYDTIEWIAAQNWCDGNVGTFGLSFFGFVQFAAASLNPPHLRCICPFECSATHAPTLNDNGSYSPYHLTWLYNSANTQVQRMKISEAEKSRIMERIEAERPSIMEQILTIHPWTDMPAINIPGFHFFDEFMESVDGNNDPVYWARIGYPLNYQKMLYPTFLLTGWYDHVRNSEMENYYSIRDLLNDKGSHDKDMLRLVIGPWAHGQAMSSTIGTIDYGENSSAEKLGLKKMMCRFFDRWLKGDPAALKDDAPVVYYTLIEDKWKSATSWPVPNCSEAAYYLSSMHSARSSLGDGCLQPTQDYSGTAEDTYVHNPSYPVPSETATVSKMNGDFSEIQKRDDVLVYTSEPFLSDTEITGCIRVELYASVDAEDGDFYVRLTDVYPDGRAIRLTSGSIRLRYYRSKSKAEYIKPGKIGFYTVQLGDLSYLVKAGHQIRLDIAGSSFPYADPNLGTREPIGRGKDAIAAIHHILHDALHPSALILPIIKR